MTKKELIERAELIIQNSTCKDYMEFELKINDWENYGKSRTYFSIVKKSRDYRVSKYYTERRYGYLDNISGEYVPDKNDLRRNYDFGGNSF